ncbi:DoxX family protein [Ancylobacter sp. Lp-2]|uniref:DoxX family protein n=1 Tax=Ancylobacter sp. Lp-2 TaxID=2881339 RepID=UPI001E525831|nr:DoxX family protein [Ancylobacter sp. Lp-2]MCB4771909.1 DoxX family protein [Ancylobacter sp. Lp-2]
MRALSGRLISSVVVAILLLDAGINIFAPSVIVPEMNAVQFPAYLAPALGLIMILCATLYAVPGTSFIGAILVTGFLGGAICTHFRVGEEFSAPQLIALALGVATWGGLYLRDGRIRDLVLRPERWDRGALEAVHERERRAADRVS